MDNQTVQNIGPAKVDAFSFIFKILAGISAGILGDVVLLVVFLLGSSVFNSVLSGPIGKVHPLFVFVFMAMLFLALLVANLAGVFFLNLTEEERYRQIASSLYQIFIINLIIFIFTAPFYFIGINIDLSAIIYIAGLQILISTIASILAFRIVSTPAYSLLGIYIIIFSTFVAIGVNYFLFEASKGNMTVLMFAAIPVVWISIGFFEALISAIYYGIYSLYGVDFLNRNTKYGDDVGMEADNSEKEEITKEQISEIKLLQKKDKTGAEFLNQDK